MYRIQKDIAYRTRQAKTGEPLDLPGKVADWEATARERDIGELTGINDAVDQAAERERARDRAWQHEHGRAASAAVLPWRGRSGGSTPGGTAAPPTRPKRQPSSGGPGSSPLNGTRSPDADPARLLDGWEAARRADAQAERDIRRETARGRSTAPGAAGRKPAPRSRSRRAATPTRHSPAR